MGTLKGTGISLYAGYNSSWLSCFLSHVILQHKRMVSVGCSASTIRQKSCMLKNPNFRFLCKVKILCQQILGRVDNYGSQNYTFLLSLSCFATALRNPSSFTLCRCWIWEEINSSINDTTRKTRVLIKILSTASCESTSKNQIPFFWTQKHFSSDNPKNPIPWMDKEEQSFFKPVNEG